MTSSGPDAAQVAEFWGSPERQTTGLDWIEVPAVARNVNRRATGDPNLDWLTHSEQFMAHLPKPRRALSLGCGTGVIERGVRERDVCQELEGVDLAEDAVARASELAEESGLTGLTYRTIDLNRDELPSEAYDVVYAHSVLHHVFQLEHLLDQVNGALKPNGVLVVYEFVGPTQFQWPGKHAELADKLLRAIPPRYRRLLRPGAEGLKEEAARASVAAMNAVDPSEAIRASEVVPMVLTRFDLRHYREIGGTLLLLVLNEIAGNFREGDPEADAIVDALIHLDDLLIDSRVLPSYHAYLVVEKTPNPLPMQTQTVWP
jgi:SAM-dependent methyltransferase